MSEEKVTKKEQAAAEKFQNLARAINGETMRGWPPFDARFYVLAHSNGLRTILKEGEHQVVTHMLEDGLVSEILTYCQDKLAKHKGFRFDHAMATKAMKYWLYTTPSISKPALLLELSEPGLCFHRLPFDSVYDPFNAPLFDELMSRTSNNVALMLFIGSLFYENADRQQYIYLFGEGGDGKGALMRLLQKVMGPQYHAEQSTLKPNQFWTHALIDKRLVVFPEANNSKIVMSELIKTITGGDPVRVEEKNRPAYTAILRCKLIIVSNHSPTLSSNSADQRRIIVCEMTAPGKDPEMDYEDRLWKEAAFIIGSCRGFYVEHATSNKLLPCDRDLADLAAAETEQKLCDLFEENFLVDAKSSISGSELLQMLRMSGVTNNMAVKDFTAYMTRKYGIRKKRKENGVIYFGIRSKLATERAGRRNHLGVATYDS